MESEFNLSKRCTRNGFCLTSDVREFIRRLKEIKFLQTDRLHYFIDKLAGEKLIVPHVETSGLCETSEGVDSPHKWKCPYSLCKGSSKDVCKMCGGIITLEKEKKLR